MLVGRSEFHVMNREKAVELQVVIHELFENVFLHERPQYSRAYPVTLTGPFHLAKLQSSIQLTFSGG